MEGADDGGKGDEMRWEGWLLLTKAKRLLNGNRQLLFEGLIRLVRRQVDPVEARVTLGQLADLARLLDRKAPRAIRPLEVLEAVDRNARRAGRELEEARLLLSRPGGDALPEPADDLVPRRVAALAGVQAESVTRVSERRHPVYEWDARSRCASSSHRRRCRPCRRSGARAPARQRR